MMKNKLKQALTAVFAAGLLTTVSHAHAASYSCDPCYDPCDSGCMDWCGGFEVGAEFILWKPCYKVAHAATGYTSGAYNVSNTTANGKVKYVDSDFTPGVRAFIGKSEVWCDWDLIGSYTYLNATDSSTVSSAENTNGQVRSTLLHTAIGNPLNVTAITTKYKQQYHQFDILMSKAYCPCESQTLTPFFGVAGMYFNGTMNHAVTTATINYSAKLDQDFWGVGLKAGTTYNYELCDCFGMFATASGTLLVGDSSGSFHYADTTSSTPSVLNLKNSPCLCIPGWHIQIGFDYDDCYCGWDFNARIGYEFVQWHGFPLPRNLESSSATAAEVSTTSEVFGFQGLFAGISVKF